MGGRACGVQGGVVFAVSLVQQRGAAEDEVPVSAIVGVRCVDMFDMLICMEDRLVGKSVGEGKRVVHMECLTCSHHKTDRQTDRQTRLL